MKRGFLGRVIGSAAAVCCMAMTLAGCGGSDSSSAGTGSAASLDSGSAQGSSGKVYTECATGRDGEYDFELWKDRGDTTMALGEGGNFSCEWKNINNALFRRGCKYDCTKTYKELGEFTIDYGVDYQPDGNSYLCVYGWTRDPLIEYYIVESWGSWRPPGQAEVLGTVSVDGGVYDIYRTTRYNQPSIDGTKTFDQFWSVRKTKPKADGTKIEGTISVSKHFQAWESVGLELGKMYEVAFNVEGYQSKGKADIYKNELKITGDSYTADAGLEVKKSQKSGGDSGASGGKGSFTDDFASDTGDWQPRGDGVNIERSSDKTKDGKGSLHVSGRTQNWHGTQIPLDSKVYKGGTKCSFKADVMQESGKEQTLKLTLQFNQGGSTHYSGIVQADAASGEWVTLSSDDFVIEEGASDIMLYVESIDAKTDIYIDNVSASAGDAPAESKSDDSSKAEVTYADPVEVKNTADTSWIDPSKPMVAISFDDGASATKKGDPAYRIIDAVANSGFHATFFYVGNWIKTEEQVKYAYEKGMEIANHTTTHPYLSKCDSEKIRSEVEKTHEKLKGIIGTDPSRIMRLPYLDVNVTVKKTLNDVALISCAIDTQDWNKTTAAQIVEKIKKAKENGSLENSIVLCHENYASTAEAMEEIIPWLKEEGWQVVTISEMFAVKGKPLMGGTVYTKAV